MAYSPKSSNKKDKLVEDSSAFPITTDKSVATHEKLGHRGRVKERFKKQEIASFSNADLIEALLFFCNARRDVRPEAKILDKISKGSILKFLFLSEDFLKINNITYVRDNLLFLNKIILEFSSRFFKDKIIEFTFENTEQIKDYLISRAAFLPKEEMRILFLNAKNKLIDDGVFSRGTVNETAIYVREVVSLAISQAAMSIIISHNHPSGDIKPSMADVAVTHKLKFALEGVSVLLQDHIIIGGTSYFSFKKEGLL